MSRTGRTTAIALLIASCMAEWAHGQPMLSYYGLELDDRFALIHSTGNAFYVLDGNHEVLMIDPVWDDMKLDAYCKLPKALLMRAFGTDNPKSSTVALASYFVINAPDANADADCTGPLSEEEFRKKLASMSVDSGDLAWVVPSDPNPRTKLAMLLYLLAMTAISVSGCVLPVPFALVFIHYVVLKRRLRKLSAVP